MMRKPYLLLFFYLGIASCGDGNSADRYFAISAVPSTMAVVPTARRSCTDIYNSDPTSKSVATSSVGFPSFRLSWTDTTRDLYIVKIDLDAEGSLLAAKVSITDPDEIGRLLGLGDGNEVKVPRMGAEEATDRPNNEYRSDLKDLNADDVMDDGQSSCPLAFGGLTVPEETQSTVGAFIRVTGIAQDDSGNQEVISQQYGVKLILFSE